MYGNASGSSPDHSHCTAPVHKNETCGGKGKARQLEQSKVLKLWGANPHHVLALITQTQLNDWLACWSYIIARKNTLCLNYSKNMLLLTQAKRRYQNNGNAVLIVYSNMSIPRRKNHVYEEF